jgi:hypothetical protein
MLNPHVVLPLTVLLTCLLIVTMGIEAYFVHRANRLAHYEHSLGALQRAYGRRALLALAGGGLDARTPSSFTPVLSTDSSARMLGAGGMPRGLFSTDGPSLDHVYFINLAHRTDRLRRTLVEVRAMGWAPITTRIDAIKHPKGEIGCVRSHVKALRTFLASPHAIALILEDDVCFDYPEKARALLDAFMRTHAAGSEWDMLLLSARVWASEAWRPDTSYAIRVLKAVLCTAYIVTRPTAAQLIHVWQTTEGKEPCDNSWFEVMRTTRTLALQPLLASQFKSFSDIRQRLVSSKRM